MRIAVISRIAGLAARLQPQQLAPLCGTTPHITYHDGIDPSSLQAMASATVVLADPALLAEGLASLPHPPETLQWVQSTFAGVNQLVGSRANAPSFTLTRLAGVFGPHMAEYCIAHIVDRERGFAALREGQAAARWHVPGGYAYRTLPQLTVGVLGLGDIGAHIAGALRTMGCTDVHALVRRQRSGGGGTSSSHSDPGDNCSTSGGGEGSSGSVGDVPTSTSAGGHGGSDGSGGGGGSSAICAAGVTLHTSFNSLARARCDYLINTLPSTPRTAGLLDGDALAACAVPAEPEFSSKNLPPLPPRAPVLINVGRGDIVSEASLLRALRHGWLSGAVLDVTPEEPLPAGSELWRAPGVTVTPHVSAKSGAADVARVFCENLRRRRAGEALLYMVDWEAGY